MVKKKKKKLEDIMSKGNCVKTFLRVWTNYQLFDKSMNGCNRRAR